MDIKGVDGIRIERGLRLKREWEWEWGYRVCRRQTNRRQDRQIDK